MRLWQSFSLLLASSTLCYCADVDLLTILKQQSGLDLFTSYVELFPDIVDQLNNGTFTLLAPTDDALNAYAINNTDISTNRDKVRALVEYHISHDTHPSASFGLQPLFPRTLLTNPIYANVTGGQRVEMMLENGKPTVLSGLKQPSHLVTPDVFFIGGLIHIIDTVLLIPLPFPQTITGTGLTNLVALLNAGGWVNPNSIAVEIVNSLSDLTLFGPNDPRYGASFTGFEGLSEQQLDDIFKYSVVQGPVIYSSVFRNNTSYKTLDGRPVTFTQANGGFYVDQALIKTRDYICANGVLQLTDQPLSPNNTGTRPAIVPVETPKSSHKGLSGAAAAGVGITIGVLLLGGGIVAALIIRQKKRRRGQQRLDDNGLSRGPQESPPRGSIPRQVTQDTVELEFHGAPPRYDAHELDDKALDQGQGRYERHQIGTTVVELRSPSSEPALPNSPIDIRATSTRPPSRARTTSSPTARQSVASVGGFSFKAPAGGGLPPTPPKDPPTAPLPPLPIPIEIDGQERSRIRISITGETPRHLGFQARY